MCLVCSKSLEWTYKREHTHITSEFLKFKKQWYNDLWSRSQQGYITSSND